MASSALNQLQEQIEAVRREAYAAGYAAALESIRDFVANATPAAQPVSTPAAKTGGRRGPRRAATATEPSEVGATGDAADTAAPPPRGRGRGRKAASTSTRRSGKATRGNASGGSGGGRPQRGNNARMIEEILQAIAPRAARPAEIRTALKDKGVDMAFTSIRHALGQLEARNAIEPTGDKMWRLRGQAGAD